MKSDLIIGLFEGTVGFIVGIAVSIVIIYSCYWVAKTVSYTIFYEDMVERTVIEMVKPESLKATP